MNMEPIGFVHSSKKNPYEAARQPTAAAVTSTAAAAVVLDYIQLNPGNNFEQALTGLNTFSHIWVIFQFDRNQNWKPMVMPPRGTSSKQGVFATRSPHRPNAIGISAVPLVRIDGLKIFIGEHDLLDQTPILDIKPYLPYADAIPTATSGWIEEGSFAVEFTEECENQLQFLEASGVSELRAFLLQQLAHDPANADKKRVKAHNDYYTIAYRTWRADFNATENSVQVFNLHSGYSKQDLSSEEDKYQDKNLHRQFTTSFSKK